MLYRLLAGYFQIAIGVFFGRIEVEGAESVPERGPVLLVSNHANALVDPFLVLRPLRRRVELTAKSTLAANPLVRFVIWGLDVVLFHRRQDVDRGARPAANRESLERCRELLHRGGAVCIFPEGQSHSEPAMRAFRSGAGRIALDYLERYPEGERLRIVPVGLHYERKDRFRSRAWVRFGAPMDVAAWRAANPEGDARELTERVEDEVRRLQVDFETPADPEVFEFLVELGRNEGRAPRPLGMEGAELGRPQRLRELQRTRERLRDLDPRRLDLLQARVLSLRRKLERLGIAASELFLPLTPGRAAFFLLRELELFVVGLPLRLWGELNHLLPFQLTKALTARLSDDDDQVASNAVFLSLPIFPLFYCIQTLAVGLWMGSAAALAYLVLLPYSGAVALLHRDRSGSAWRRASTFLRFLRAPAIQTRLAAEARDLLAEVEAAEREMARRAPDLVLDFLDERAERLEWTGGKGANLSRTARLGFPVPAGCVVTAAAFAAFVGEQVSARVEELAGVGLTDPARLREVAAAIRGWVVEAPFPAPVEEAIRQRAAPLLEQGPVAVRSSSTQEDLGGAAFAGQHDTFLHVATLPAVLDAVRRCFASLWEERAVRYRLEKGFRLEEAEMAVVVQRMVAAEVAGVAFSVHPVSGALDRVLVNAAFGLGETVVSGEGEVDQFELDTESGAVLESRIARKSHRLVGVAGGGVAREDVPEREADQPSLDATRLDQIRHLARDAERAFGFPQDIEWAFEARKLYLLQSRPVSAIPPRWTREESAERFPNPITPLTWDFTREGFHESLAYSFELMGLPPFEGLWFERFDGFVYGNQNAVELYARGRGFAPGALDDPAALLRVLAGPYRWARELPAAWMRDLDRYLLALGRLGARPLAELEEPELWAHVLEIDRVGREYFRPNIAISLTQGALHRLLYALLQRLVGPEVAPRLHDDLTCFCETKTALVNADLLALARLAAADPALAQRIRAEAGEEVLRTGFADHPEFAEAWRRFLEIHGHREVEFDAYVPTWSGQPQVVLDHLRLLLDTDGAMTAGQDEVAARDRQHRAEVRLLADVPEELRFVVGEVIRLTRVYTALDDLEHYETTRLSVPFRAALVALGERLHSRGAVASPADVFFLHREEVEDLVAGRLEPSTAAARAAERKREHGERLRSSPPGVLGETHAPVPEGGLQGIPGSPGTAEGPVFRVFSAEDFARFPAGAVLVARTTNPAWTPLFYSASAVITESGGPLSHGAVTAREIGLPAVMAIPGALGLFEDGERVRVHGGAGAVERL